MKKVKNKMDKHIDMLGSIKSKEEFLEFMKHFTESVDDVSLHDYLESLTAWVEDSDGYYYNSGKEIPENINWDFIATLLYAGSIYE